MEKKTTKLPAQSIIIYKDSKGNVELKADIGNETIWATQAQIAKLFDVDRTVVTKHIANVLKDAEVDEKSNVQKMHITNSDKPITTYSLDIILAVGYRTNSNKAMGFRRWATKTLREHILTGATVNSDRIKQLHADGIRDLQAKIAFIQGTIQGKKLGTSEVDGLLSVISSYAESWLLLKTFDEGEIVLKRGKAKEKVAIEYSFARNAIDMLKKDLMGRGQASDIFGRERDESFQGILRTIYQTYSGQELYQSLEEKAAHLLYFIIKDHPFSDGNKRIGSFVFIIFLERNGLLYSDSGERKVHPNALVALALLVAESDPKQKEVMVALITNLIG